MVCTLKGVKSRVATPSHWRVPLETPGAGGCDWRKGCVGVWKWMDEWMDGHCKLAHVKLVKEKCANKDLLKE